MPASSWGEAWGESWGSSWGDVIQIPRFDYRKISLEARLRAFELDAELDGTSLEVRRRPRDFDCVIHKKV